MNIEDLNKDNYTLDNLQISDKWILTKLENIIKKVRKRMDNYEFNVVGTELYSFIWDDFCDWYIELAKGNMNNTTKSVLLTVLTDILKMLHPFMPYVTEEIYQMLPLKDKESIMISSYPVYNKELVFEDSKELDNIIDFIVKVRTAKLEHKIPKDSKIYFKGNYQELILKSLKVDNNNLKEDNNEDGIEIKSTNYEIKYMFDTTGDKEKELENLLKEKARLEASIERRKKLLSNENYVSKAPANIVNKEKEDLLKEENELKLLIEKMA